MNKIFFKLMQITVQVLYLAMLAVIVFIIITWFRRFQDLYQIYGFSVFDCITKHGASTYLIPFAVFSTALVSLQTFNRNINDRRSRFFFEQSIKDLEEVFKMLSDKNNNRTIWIRAARTLLWSINMSKQITLKEYKDAFLIEKERIASQLYTALSYDQDEYHSLPARFFYGLPDWNEPQAANRTLNQSACLAILQHADRLNRQSVVAIYDFILKPPSKLSYWQRFEEQLKRLKKTIFQMRFYWEWGGLEDDPLHYVDVWTFPSTLLMNSGACEYMNHRSHFIPPDSDADLQRCVNVE